MGAIAAEQVFYGENSRRRRRRHATPPRSLACMMVGAYAMGPQRIEFGSRFPTQGDEDEARERS